MTDTDKSVCVNREPLVQFVIFNAKETGDWAISIPHNIEDDLVWDGINASNVEEVDATEGGVHLEGRFDVPAVVDKIPAGGGSGLRPINPPEYITEDRTVFFTVEFQFEDFGLADTEVVIA